MEHHNPDARQDAKARPLPASLDDYYAAHGEQKKDTREERRKRALDALNWRNWVVTRLPEGDPVREESKKQQIKRNDQKYQ